MQTRQQALATAQLYVRRFYTKVPIRDINPYLVLATCLYLALKMEECPQHIRIVVSEARTIWSDVMPNDTAKFAEMRVLRHLRDELLPHCAPPLPHAQGARPRATTHRRGDESCRGA